MQLSGVKRVRIAPLRKRSKTSAKENSRVLEEQFFHQMLKSYTAALKKAKTVERPVRFSIEVLPDGSTNTVTIAAVNPIAEGDALESGLAVARERGAMKIADILKGDEMLTASQFGSLIGASHETVNVKRGRGEVLGLQGVTRGMRYPSWQVTDAGMLLPGLSKLFEVLGRHPWTVYRFLRSTHAELGGKTALDAIKAGHQETVIGLARNQMNGAFS